MTLRMPKAELPTELRENMIAQLGVEYVKADISGRLLIDALGETAYQRLLATPDMRAVMTPLEL